KNTTDVDILINSQELKAGDSMKVSSLQNPSESTDQPSDKPQQEMSADENIPETGDDTNRTLMFVIMGLAAIAAAGTVVYGRRKRSN
ncbi:MAG: LPXTG cell wall anchor domain-containing protein, partial [Anaerovoracaceae bacterium]|nr:LPXTG cell wall anchor domain-containing protein [Anaerovoracaceae bacterium]